MDEEEQVEEVEVDMEQKIRFRYVQQHDYTGLPTESIKF